ncbi:hypothetical protein TNCV_1277841, partial [Trichonephila clavipes]
MLDSETATHIGVLQGRMVYKPTPCRNEVGTLGTKDEEMTAEMDKGIMVADSFRSEQECCADKRVTAGIWVRTTKTLERIKYSSLWEGLRADEDRPRESCKSMSAHSI